MGSTAVDDATMTRPPFKVLVVGGSYGGLSAALNLQDICSGRAARCGPDARKAALDGTSAAHDGPQFAVDITVVDERDGFYHLIGSPLAFADESYAEKCWVKYEDVPALQQSPNNIRILRGSVQSIDQERKVAKVLGSESGPEPTELKYDYLIAAAGLRRAFPVVPQSLLRKQFLFEAGDHIQAATANRHGVAVVGGGAVGVEMAAELKLVCPDLKVTLIHSRDKLLSAEPLPDEVKDRSLELVHEAGIEVLMSHRVDRTEEFVDNGHKAYKVYFTNGHTLVADSVIMAISRSMPSTTFLPSEVLNEEGYVMIQPSLHFPSETPNSDDHLAIGDLVKWSGIKRCGGAMHMGYLAANNIHMRMKQAVSGTEPTYLELDEIPPMIGLAVGKKAVAYWPTNGVTSGEDVNKLFFGDDLGFDICWNHLRLGGYDVIKA
ncbi:hypothetical protein QBC32DRAFT_242838 [Pseudoneurospora amorphoporcata]|uniref:FAD/NAD(P)-binding domain-containing protein n=1 Tax=Pseudoneurospora amorphoporcata TaxID=241081 RepID=A0AAN6NRS4_9PEZI|nr:hypothetical protein QBC32DRAFT_242838 [Pseudoneurospora amorphoporcata]